MTISPEQYKAGLDALYDPANWKVKCVSCGEITKPPYRICDVCFEREIKERFPDDDN